MNRRRTCALLIDYYGGEYQIGLMEGAEETTIRDDNHLLVVVGRWLQAPKTIDLIQNDIFYHLKPPGVDAIVVGSGCLSHYVSKAELAQFIANFAPLPVVSVSVQVPGVPSIIIDNRRGQQQIVDHLIDVHHVSRLAYIRGPSSSVEAGERFEGYKDSLRNHDIDYDPSLVIEGNFWLDSGDSSVRKLLDSGVKFEALVAANDYMAIGALDTLKARGLRVPQDVCVVGFDDAPSARMASPSLTTVRQPLHRMGALAVELLEQLLDGKSVPAVQSLDIELIRRQSCGCAHSVVQVTPTKHGLSASAANVSSLPASRDRLQKKVLDAIYVHSGLWPEVVAALITALLDDYAGKSGEFLRVLAEQLEFAKSRVDILDQFYNIITTLRTELLDAFPEPRYIEQLSYSAILAVSEGINRVQMRALFDQEATAVSLRASVERLSTVLTKAALSEALDAILPTTAIRSACLSLYENGTTERLSALSVTGVANATELHWRTFESAELAPPGFFSPDRRHSFVLMPLTHGDSLYGQALFEAGEFRTVYAMLREQTGALLKAAALHRTVVEETARRERAERERLERETEIAQQIQTAILPGRLVVPGLEIVALMRPAATVGGDYYDVIPTDGGCFIGIGDVTGHGLLAGMIMLMVQSMVTATIHSNPERSPSQILPPINNALYDNIRHRLHGTDHVTLTLIKYENTGKLLFAGAHDDPLIWRKSTGKCEQVNSPGFWLGAIADVASITHDLEVQLQDGDLLVLYTDGITEALNNSHEQLGIEQLSKIVERHGAESPQRICDAILHALAAWSNTQIDDVSLLVARFNQGSVS